MAKKGTDSETLMIRLFAASMVCIALFSSTASAQDLSRYRDFHFGMDPESVVKQININPSAVKTTHRQPAVVQTLQWDPLSVSALVTDRSLRSVRFDFYNSELFKMIVTYDLAGTEGLTTDDMIEAISAVYGSATRPDGTIAVSSLIYEDEPKILARWEDAQYSISLFRAFYGNTFGLIASSKKLDLMASDSIRESDRLERLEAPQRERALQIKLEEDKRKALEKARLANRPKFRP